MPPHSTASTTLPQPWRTRATAVLRDLAATAALCVAIAVLLSVVFSYPLARALVFSLCIGFSCLLLIDGGCRLAAQALLRLRPGEAAQDTGWPGWPWALPIIVMGSWGGVQIGFALAAWLLGIEAPAPGLNQPRMLFINLAVSVAAAGLMVFWSWSRARMASIEGQAQAALRAAAESQLKLLESQLEPHMLFNTLANLRVLIALDAIRAQAMLDHLIAFLRATLNASRAGLHPLADEFARLADYLALMAVRMGPRLQTALDLPENLRGLPVPPLLLQPLVENSIKHGLETKVEGGRIDVRAQREGECLVLTVRDSGVGLSASAAQGSSTQFGLDQVRQRLATLYGARASLVLEPLAQGGTQVRITLPWPTPP